MSEEDIVPTAPVAASVESAVPEPEVSVTPAVEEAVVEPKVLTPEEQQRKQFDRDAAAQRRKYERELQAEREQRIRLEERLAQHQPARQAEDNEPKLENFDNFDDYVTAKANFVADRRFDAKIAEALQRTAQERANSAQMETEATWNRRVAESGISDFDDVISSSSVPMTQAMQQMILESKVGPKVAYHLATNPEEATRIAGLTPIGAVRALTLIEEGFKKPVAVTKATPPITPVGSRSTSIKSLVDVKDYDEFSKRREAQIAKRR